MITDFGRLPTLQPARARLNPAKKVDAPRSTVHVDLGLSYNAHPEGRRFECAQVHQKP